MQLATVVNGCFLFFSASSLMDQCCKNNYLGTIVGKKSKSFWKHVEGLIVVKRLIWRPLFDVQILSFWLPLIPYNFLFLYCSFFCYFYFLFLLLCRACIFWALVMTLVNQQHLKCVLSLLEMLHTTHRIIIDMRMRTKMTNFDFILGIRTKTCVIYLLFYLTRNKTLDWINEKG